MGIKEYIEEKTKSSSSYTFAKIKYYLSIFLTFLFFFLAIKNCGYRTVKSVEFSGYGVTVNGKPDVLLVRKGKDPHLFFKVMPVTNITYTTNLDGTVTTNTNVQEKEVILPDKVHFKVKRVGQVYTLRVSCPGMRQDGEDTVNVYLLDSKGKEICAYSVTFWRESGYDDEGYWEESDTSDDFDFVLRDKNGITVYIEADSLLSNIYFPITVELLEKKAPRVWPLWLLGFFWFFVIFYYKAKVDESKPGGSLVSKGSYVYTIFSGDIDIEKYEYFIAIEVPKRYANLWSREWAEEDEEDEGGGCGCSCSGCGGCGCS